jgi:hypothetical protein
VEGGDLQRNAPTFPTLALLVCRRGVRMMGIALGGYGTKGSVVMMSAARLIALSVQALRFTPSMRGVTASYARKGYAANSLAAVSRTKLAPMGAPDAVSLTCILQRAVCGARLNAAHSRATASPRHKGEFALKAQNSAISGTCTLRAGVCGVKRSVARWILAVA